MEELRDEIALISGRCFALRHALSLDPNRPSWQTTISDLLVQLTDICDGLFSIVEDFDVFENSVNKRFESLETRYSELLYVLSSRS